MPWSQWVTLTIITVCFVSAGWMLHPVAGLTVGGIMGVMVDHRLHYDRG